jgi:hypothetical protein
MEHSFLFGIIARALVSFISRIMQEERGKIKAGGKMEARLPKCPEMS